jgi:hypothetical protein
MAVKTVPDVVLAKHPELVFVFEALMAYSEDRPISAHCAECGHVLTVTDIPEVGALWVTCKTGCTSYRERYAAEPSEAA